MELLASARADIGETLSEVTIRQRLFTLEQRRASKNDLVAFGVRFHAGHNRQHFGSRILRSLLNGLNRALQILAALMLLAIVLIVLGNVFLRYFLHIGLGWTEEAARFLQIGMTFVAAAIAVKRWGHFQLLVIRNYLPKRCHRAIQFFAVFVVLLMSVILFRYGISIARISWFQASPTMGWSMGYLYCMVPISGAIMFVFALEHLVNLIQGGNLPGHDEEIGVPHGHKVEIAEEKAG